MMNKTLDKQITPLVHVDKTLLVSLGASSGVSLYSFSTVIGTKVWIASASICLVLLINNESNEIVKMFLKTMRKKKISEERLVYYPEVI